MSIIINPGSKNTGGTFEQARLYAEEKLRDIHEKGILEVEMSFVGQCENGNFEFNFRHRITQKFILFETHGFTEEECQKFLFYPRTYWDGSSSRSPEIEDWLGEDYKYRIEYYRS